MPPRCRCRYRWRTLVGVKAKVVNGKRMSPQVERTDCFDQISNCTNLFVPEPNHTRDSRVCSWLTTEVEMLLTFIFTVRRRHAYHIEFGLHPVWARGTPFPPLLLPCSFTSSSFALYYLFPFLIHFTYFLLLSIQSLSTRIVPLRFQAWGRRRQRNLGLVCFVLWLCYLYCLVKIYSGILLYLV